MVMISTVFLLAIVMLVAWGLSPLLAALWLLPFAFIEGAFLSSNLLNIPHGGWFSIAMALGITSISVIWIWGSAQKQEAFKR
jgi:KUP system potassium uptake protein